MAQRARCLRRAVRAKTTHHRHGWPATEHERTRRGRSDAGYVWDSSLRYVCVLYAAKLLVAALHLRQPLYLATAQGATRDFLLCNDANCFVNTL